MKHILLPTDFSENSWNAITYSIQLFKNEVCTFHLLHAYTPVIYRLDYVVGYPEQLGFIDDAKDTARNNLHEVVTRISSKFKNNSKHNFKTYARFDTLVSGIREFIDLQNIHLIVMGTKGATGAKEILLGSNSVQVFNKINYPILIIPAGFIYVAPNKILFPTDLDAIYRHSTLKTIKELAISNQARVNVIHIFTGSSLTEKQETNKLKLESIFKHSAFLFHDIKNVAITEGINNFQLKHNSNLLVMINNKHSFFENLFFKNIMNQIGFHLNIPFLVIPSEERMDH